MLQVATFVFSPLQENTYILYNEERVCCVIDPGCYFASERVKLQNFINDHHLEANILLNTHCHLDHVFGNKFVSGTWGLVPHIHAKEKPVLQVAGEYGRMWNLPFDAYEGEVQLLEEGDLVHLGQDELRVLFTPGHAPGHICFYCVQQGFVISGDTLFRMSIGRTDLPYGDHDTLINSIRTKLFTLPDDTIIYPGHGPSTTVGYEKQHNPFLR